MQRFASLRRLFTTHVTWITSFPFQLPGQLLSTYGNKWKVEIHHAPPRGVTWHFARNTQRTITIKTATLSGGRFRTHAHVHEYILHKICALCVSFASPTACARRLNQVRNAACLPLEWMYFSPHFLCIGKSPTGGQDGPRFLLHSLRVLGHLCIRNFR